MTWPNATIILGVMVVVIILVVSAISTHHDLSKAKLEAAQADDLRQLVRRFEQLAESLELSADGKAMKYFEVTDFDVRLNAAALAEAAASLTSPARKEQT